MDEYFNAINKVAQDNNAWSAAQAKKQMDFQERMSSTAHQREVADLQAAGLNPVLSAHTNGATTPNGSLPSVDAGNTEAMFGLMSKMLDAQLASAEALAGHGSGSGTGLTSGSSDGVRPLGDFISSLPDKGSTRLFGINLPNSTWKYLYNQYGSRLDDYVVNHGQELLEVAEPSGKKLFEAAKKVAEHITSRSKNLKDDPIVPSYGSRRSGSSHGAAQSSSGTYVGAKGFANMMKDFLKYGVVGTIIKEFKK